MGCKCGAGADLEKQILKNTRAIAAYLNERSRRLTEEAEKTKVTSAE